MSWENISKYRPYGYSTKTYDKDLLKAFIEDNNIVRFTYSPPSWTPFRRYLETGADRGRNSIEESECEPPHSDHKTFFKRKDGTVIFVYQPYPRPDSYRNEDEKWIANRRLKVETYGKEYSWYYPYGTELVVVTLPGVDVVVNKTKKKAED